MFNLINTYLVTSPHQIICKNINNIRFDKGVIPTFYNVMHDVVLFTAFMSSLSPTFNDDIL